MFIVMSMAACLSTSTSPSPTCIHTHPNPNPNLIYSSPLVVILPFTCKTTRLRALKFGADGSDLLRKPVARPPNRKVPSGGIFKNEEEDEDEVDDEDVAWEDQILEDTVPLVGFVRMLIHSDRYESGERLIEEHEQTICDKLLPYHPECEKKIGPGIDYITVGYHPDFEGSRCLFIARKDGELVDFSYWKCIKGLIKKNYPLYADSFILRHFRRHRQRE